MTPVIYMPNNPTYFAVLEACTLPGCPVCRLEQQAVTRYLEHLFYENVNDGGMRSHLRNSLGFCREHSALLLETGVGDALGMSIIYHDVFGTLLKKLSRWGPVSDRTSLFARLFQHISTEAVSLTERVKQAVSRHLPCPACLQRDRTSRMVLSVLAESIYKKEMQVAFTKSEGLCLPHLCQICEQVNDETALASILQIELKKLEKLHSELAEFIRKSDYRFLKDGFGSEGNAWRRAAFMAAGGWMEKSVRTKPEEED